MSKLLNILFVVELAVIGLVITGVLPRTSIVYLAAALAIYIIIASLEDSTTFFVRSIPFFVAIPLTIHFDSLNTWRVISGIIFLKWLGQKETRSMVWDRFRSLIQSPKNFFKEHPILIMLSILLVLVLLSLTQASSLLLAVKRIIYFINLSLIGIVIHDLIQKNKNFGARLIKNISIPVIIVALVGIAQLISTYFLNIFQFVDFWARRVELGLFGTAWANIAVKANTWFAYFGDQLSLRIFSLFPDSHSFPIFLLLGLPAVFAVSLVKLLEKGPAKLKEMFKTRVGLTIVFVPIIFLTAILSGTRGIWAASVPIAVLILATNLYFKRKSVPTESKNIFNYISAYLVIFFLLFAVAYPILASDQFEVSKENSLILERRVTSIIDISETSNSQRIKIWKASLVSLKKHPLLGVGIGNFPVVLGQDLGLAKAGSSAHNLYLHIAAEMGVLALIVVVWFLWRLFKGVWQNFLHSGNSHSRIYFAALLIFLPWILIYSLTDVAIFDERAFLLFVTTAALILGQK